MATIQSIRYADPRRQNKAPAMGFTGIQSFNDLIEGMNQTDKNIETLEEIGDGSPELSGSQENYLDALEKSKQTLRERTPFLMDKPEKPELDEEQAKRFKNMSTAGSLAQLIDAVGDIAMGAGNKNYRPVANTTGADVAIQGANKLYDMDARQQEELKRYKDQVFTIDNKNALSEHQTEALNDDIATQKAGVDVEKAQARLNFEMDNEEKERLKKEAEYDALDDDSKRYFDSGLRLISQGEEEAGLTMLEKAGLSTKEAMALIGKGNTGKSATTISRLNEYMGYDGKKNSVTNLDLEMLKQYRALKKEIAEDGGARDFNAYTGDPITERGRTLQALEKELGKLRFAPENMLAEDVNKGAKGQLGDGETAPKVDREAIAEDNARILQELQEMEDPTEEQVQPYLKQLYDNGAKLGLSPEEVQQELQSIGDPESEYNQSQVDQIEIPGATEPSPDARVDTEEGEKELQRYAFEAREAFMNIEEQEVKQAILFKLGRVLERGGMSDEDIQHVIEGIISAKGSANPGEEVTEVESQPTPKKEGGPTAPGFLGRDLNKAGKAVGSTLNTAGSKLDSFLKSQPFDN